MPHAAVPSDQSLPSNGAWLSILIPVYNVEPYLNECLDSILAQAGTGVEVIALDDCSTDRSAALLAQRLASYRGPAALRVMQHKRNGGLSAARNSLLTAAGGDYVWFVDSDDYLAAGAVDELRAIVQQHRPDLILCDYRILRARMTLKHRLRGEWHRRTFVGTAGQPAAEADRLVRGLFAAGQMFAWAKIFRRAIWPLGQPLFEVGRYFEDAHSMPLLALKARSHYYAARPWVVYRHRPGSILRTMDVGKAADLASAFCDFAREARAGCHEWAAATRFAIANQAARNFIAACRHAAASETVQPEDFGRFRQALMESLGMPLQQLLRQYMARLWWWRALRLLAWASRGRRPGAVFRALF